MKNILVIGTNSYIGRSFYNYAIVNHKDDMIVDLISASNGEWERKDFTRYDVVIHLSAIVHRKDAYNMKELYEKVNHVMAVEIAKKAKNSGVKQFIFMSTAAVYGNNIKHITKNTTPVPTTYYGKSKLTAELDIVKLQSNVFKVAIIRPPMVYGEECKGNYVRLVKLVRFTPLFPEIHNKRSMIYINTLVEFILLVIKEDKYGHYHPQDESYVDICDLVVKVRKEMGKKTYLVRGFSSIIKFLGKYVASVNKMFSDYYYDMDLE